MQEIELRECVERIFIAALARAYQRDVFIDLYHVLRESWHELAQSCEHAIYISRVTQAIEQIRSITLHCRQSTHITEEDRSIIQELEEQLLQLEKQAYV